MKERAATSGEVEEVLKNPGRLEPSVKGKYNAFKFVNGRFVRVTYQELADHLLVITVVVRKRSFQGAAR